MAAFRAFRATVREQLGIEPSEGTRALVEELLAEPNAVARAVAPRIAPPLARPDPVPLVGRTPSCGGSRRRGGGAAPATLRW